MVLELHVWGPAFGLPSIDAECIAVIAYLQRIVPHGEWKLVASHDTSIGPQGRFPLLIDGKAKATGFSSIIAYLQNQRPEAYDLDRNLSPQQKTDSTAFATFLESSATPLIDLSLYVSAENYNGLTSAAYTAILPWYMNYTIPPRRRDLARSRTVQLGLSSLDVDTTSEEGLGPGRGTASAEFEAAKRAAGLPTDGPPKVLSMGRGKGIGGLLGSPVYAARVKLDALSNEVLEPLSDLLTKQDYLFGSSLSSLDCLAFGYLSLMFYPAVPQAWLKETIQNKFPDIAKYTQNLRETLIGNDETNPSDVWSICSGRSVTTDTKATVHGSRLRLPWGPGISNPQFGIAIRELTSGIPLLQRAVVVQPSSSKSLKQVRSSLPSPLVVNSILGVTATIAVGLASVAVHHRRSPRDGDLIFWALRPTTGFGEAGNILSVLANQLPNDAFSRF